MDRECCLACGHLLSRNRSVCLFFDWAESSDQYLYSLKVENGLLYLDSNEISQDQLPGFSLFFYLNDS
jgi:hypothetical protein